MSAYDSYGNAAPAGPPAPYYNQAPPPGAYVTVNVTPAAGYQTAGYQSGGYQSSVPAAGGYQSYPPQFSEGASAPAAGGYQTGGYQTGGYQPVGAGGAPYSDGQDYYNKPLVGGAPGGVVDGTPLYPDNPALSSRFVVRGARDVWAAVIFLIQLAATVVVAFVNIPALRDQNDNFSLQKDSGLGSFGAPPGMVVGYMILAVILSLVTSVIAAILMRAIPFYYIWAGNIFLILVTAACAITSFVVGIWFAGIVFVLVAGLQALWLWCVRKRIPLAAELLGTATQVMTKYFGTFLTAFLAVFVSVVYYLFFAGMTIPSMNNLVTKYAPGSTGSPFGYYILACVFLLMFYWTVQVIFNVVHVTAAGTMATWYFAGPEAMPPSPTPPSLKRAMTTSFGSICFGSLLVAILKLMHAMARSARRGNNGVLAAIAMCLVGCLERLVEYFNIYAFVHVAIYGSSYIEAAKQTWALVRQSFCSAIINDNLVYPVLNLTTIIMSALIAIICGVASHFQMKGALSDGYGPSVIIGILSFMIALCIHITIFRVIYSGVVTMFVCIAECPDALLQSNPTLRVKLDEAIATAAEGPCA